MSSQFHGFHPWGFMRILPMLCWDSGSKLWADFQAQNDLYLLLDRVISAISLLGKEWAMREKVGFVHSCNVRWALKYIQVSPNQPKLGWHRHGGKAKAFLVSLRSHASLQTCAFFARASPRVALLCRFHHVAFDLFFWSEIDWWQLLIVLNTLG